MQCALFTKQEGDAKGQSHRPIFATDCSVTHNGSGDVIKVTVTAVEKKKTVKHMASQKLLMKLKALHGEKWVSSTFLIATCWASLIRATAVPVPTTELELSNVPTIMLSVPILRLELNGTGPGAMLVSLSLDNN